MCINANYFRPHLMRKSALNQFRRNPPPEVVSMRIEVGYSRRGTTRSVLKWIAVGMALRVLILFCERSCCRTFFCFFVLLMAAGWMTEEKRDLVSLPLPITKVGLMFSRFSSMRITTANVDAG